MKSNLKKLIRTAFIFSLLFSLSSVLAQAPQKMSYQAVIRNASNVLVTSATVGMRISILQGSASGTAVYLETQTPSTNENGLVSIEMGTGSVVSGNFSTINWGAGPYFIKTETDPTGGSGYSIIGTSQMMSVPYALFAANSTPGPPGPAGTTAPNTVDTAGVVAAPTASSHRYTWKTDKNGNPAWRKENKTTYYIENF